jgi:hypothetical protein
LVPGEVERAQALTLGRGLTRRLVQGKREAPNEGLILSDFVPCVPWVEAGLLLFHSTILWSCEEASFPQASRHSRSLRIAPMPVPASDEQIRAIRALSADGQSSKEIAAKLGLATMQVAGVKAAETRGAYGAIENAVAPEDTEVASAVDTAFGLERDMQKALRENIEQLEPGLTIDDGGRERTVASGRIDITARDTHGNIVVIELKTGEADRDAVAQILAYMGDLIEDQPNASIRGVLIAKSFEPRARAAARAVSSIQLVQYVYLFTFEKVGRNPI